MQSLLPRDGDTSKCHGPPPPFKGSMGLRVGALFIILVSSTLITLFPVLSKRVSKFSVPVPVYDFAKYFGSGVIIATSLIHLLEPGNNKLSSPCLSPAFQGYPFAYAFCMIAMFAVFIVELVCFRVGKKLATRLVYEGGHGGHHHANEHAERVAIQNEIQAATPANEDDIEKTASHSETSQVEVVNKEGHHHSSSVEPVDPNATLSSEAGEILGVMILEFGVIFHSVIIGMTLAVTQNFNILFTVIIFHQMFEGLGLGTRLAILKIRQTWIPVVGGIAYGVVTPLGMAIGLGVRHVYNRHSTNSNYIQGVLDSVSAGILLYTGTVELLAHEFVFSDKMRKKSLGEVMICVCEMMAGAGIMALLGKWA